MTRHLAILLLSSVLADGQSPAYKIGDRAEALEVAWYKGAITQIRDAKNVGFYLINYDDFSTRRYHKAAIRARRLARL